MSQPNPTVFFIAIFREDQPGTNYKVLTSLSGLLAFVERMRYEKLRGFDSGPFDVFQVDVEAMEVGRYDMTAIQKLMTPFQEKKKK